MLFEHFRQRWIQCGADVPMNPQHDPQTTEEETIYPTPAEIIQELKDLRNLRGSNIR